MIPFVKMHGIGNDYVYIDAVTRPQIEERPPGDLADLARSMSDRHRGVGSDGLILVCRPESPVLRPGTGGTPASPAAPQAHVRMRMFNADGSESEMCGNGVRCVAKFAHDRLGVTANPMLVETGRGVLSIAYANDERGKLVRATVDMGEPILATTRVPTTLAPNHPTGAAVGVEWPALSALGLEDVDARVTAVSMGNPHAVLFCRDVSRVPLDRIGPALERDGSFPSRVNIHAVAVESREVLRMRTWERGAGLTQACGTGACAVLVAAALIGVTSDAMIHLPGGRLHVKWGGVGTSVFMTGPAQDVFEGVWPE
jgi:diaminopimelate epimerase